MNEKLRRLREYLDENQETIPIYKAVLKALETGLKPDLESSSVVQEPATQYKTDFFVPHLSSPAVSSFIGEIAATRMPKSILDPTCGSGILLKTVADRTDASTVHGVEIAEDIARTASSLLGESASVFVGDILQSSLPLKESYDLIVAEPPFGLKMKSPVKIEGAHIPLHGTFSDVLAAWTCTKLSDAGMAILILPSAFLWSKRSEHAKKAMADLGCTVTGCIHLPNRSLQGTEIEAYVVIIEHGDQDTLFVGQYTADIAHQRVLIKNLISHKEGHRPAQGRLCSWSNFRGYAAIEAQDRIQRLVLRLGFEPVPMSKLVLDATKMNTKSSEQFEIKPNSVYLPLAGRGKATTTQESLLEELKDYVQLQIDPNLGDARFVAHLFNRELGQAILDTVRIGATIERVRLSDLLTRTFYIPPLKIQTKVLTSLDRIASIRGEIDELETALWTDTRKIHQLARQIEAVNHEDRFEDWIESLPFPLATILWRYRAASGSLREKYETLIHFFEALAEFIATVHLSAFSSDTEIWSQHKQGLQSALHRKNLSLERGTFGAWRCVSEYLGPRLRRMMNTSPDVCTALYRTHNLQTLSMLASSKLLGVLQQANSIRNDWVGHVGVVSEQKAKAVHDELFSLAQQCRGILGRSWLDYELIQPAESRFRDGLFHYTVRRLQGTRSAPFETAERESIEGMHDGALYLFDPSSDRGLRLLPFVRVMPSPQTEANACYFFNRLEKNGDCRYVSYHFENDPELVQNFNDTIKTMNRLGIINMRPGTNDEDKGRVSF